jgi:transposase InsO family protein
MFHWFAHYNDERPHQALGYATPREVYRFPESHGARPAKWELKSDRLRR